MTSSLQDTHTCVQSPTLTAVIRPVISMMLRLRAGRLSVAGGSRLLGGDTRSGDSIFICDCEDLEQRPAAPGQDVSSSDSDKILAAAFSSSGDYFALTDDRKRLVLYKTSPTWDKISVRWVSRRCTALTFSPCERFVLVADKSGDVFSFSVAAAREEGRLELGHLSMLLDLVVTLDGRQIITCDRDEKIRVSLWEAPHVITAFCLGHTEFVSQLALPRSQEKLLLSGSGDGTIRLWRYETGQEIQSYRISKIPRADDPQDGDQEIKRFAISRICCSPGGDHVAVLCDGIPGIYLFRLSSSLTHPQYVPLPSVPIDLDFEDSASLWVLSAMKEKSIELLQYKEQIWQLVPLTDRAKDLSETVQENWEQMKGSVTPENRFSALYKVTCDNMAAYLQKKETRIQNEKRKMSTKPAGPVGKMQKT